MSLNAHVLQAVQLRLKSEGNEVILLLSSKQFFVYIAPRIAVVWLKYTPSPPAHALTSVQVRLKSVSTEERFTVDAETLIRPISPRIAVGR
jgi:hypothetical protein